MGGAGMLSVSVILPFMGHIYDNQGPNLALRYVAILPAVLLVIFGTLYLIDRSRGGYKKETLTTNPAADRGVEMAPKS
jgi:hypothetical protein